MVWLVALAFILTPATAPAQTDADRREIAELEDAWIRAVIGRDAVQFDRYTDTWVKQGPGWRVVAAQAYKKP
jgi:hypothetical protein